MTDTCTVYRVVSGSLDRDTLEEPLVVGNAFKNSGEDFYAVKLRMFPGHTYFLRKNSTGHYTVYSRRTFNPAGAPFKYAVGYGRLKENLKTHLELFFPILGRNLYLDLFPVNGGVSESA